MQVDHINSVYKHCDISKDKNLDEINEDENLMPSCRMCNFYKSTLSIDDFRKRLTDVLMPNLRKSFDYRLALKYGLIQENDISIKFYFENVK